MRTFRFCPWFRAYACSFYSSSSFHFYLLSRCVAEQPFSEFLCVRRASFKVGIVDFVRDLLKWFNVVKQINKKSFDLDYYWHIMKAWVRLSRLSICVFQISQIDVFALSGVVNSSLRSEISRKFRHWRRFMFTICFGA